MSLCGEMGLKRKKGRRGKRRSETRKLLGISGFSGLCLYFLAAGFFLEALSLRCSVL